MSNFSKREIVWLDAWNSVARSSNSTSVESATMWADACLREYEKRFNIKSEPKTCRDCVNFDEEEGCTVSEVLYSKGGNFCKRFEDKI